jgi:hypothetical protein
MTCLYRPQTERLVLAWSGDPAFNVAKFEVKGKWTEKSAAAWSAAFRVATETLDYTPLLKPGETPTLFHFLPMAFMQRQRLLDRYSLSLGNVADAMIWRMCLLDVEGWPEGAPSLVERAVDAQAPELGNVLAEEIVEVVASFGTLVHGTRPLLPIVKELAGIVVNRGSPLGN